MTKRAAVLLAPGFEEIEAVTVIDILRRAGIDAISVGVQRKEVTGSHNITISADISLSELNAPLDACILPGGIPGAPNLVKSPEVCSLLKGLNNDGILIAAICAAPSVVLGPLGLLDHRTATGFMGTEKKFPSNTRFEAQPVVVDGNLITSRGPGTAFPFALAIVEYLAGKKIAEQLRQETMWQDPGRKMA
jgi:protein deglycase